MPGQQPVQNRGSKFWEKYFHSDFHRKIIALSKIFVCNHIAKNITIHILSKNIIFLNNKMLPPSDYQLATAFDCIYTVCMYVTSNNKKQKPVTTTCHT